MMLVLLLVVLLCNSLTPANSLNDEGYALLEFKRALAEDPEGSTSNWNESSENPCLWNGISCQEGIVVSLTIPKKNLAGSISSSVGSLFHLRHLNLRNNNLSGTLPVDLFKLAGLQSLVVRGNLLTGSIPEQIGTVTYLQTLDLSQNYFEGAVPSSLLHCRRLRTLDLSRNNFSKAIPYGFGSNLISLQKLNLSFNKFVGELPQDIGNLSNLEGTVDLSHNLFSGSIPRSLGELPEKVYIDLTYNNLSGAIPQNGALVNRGPTAFLGNPNLCGPPLKNQCISDSSPLPSFPTQSHVHGRGLRRKTLVVIIICDVVGIFLLGLLFSFCYSKLCREDDEYSSKGRGKECFCMRGDESGSVSDNAEENELVALDSKVTFNLDELLKASAFVLGKDGVGIVYKVVLESGLSLAVRRLGEGGSQKFKEFQSEVEAVGRLKHPNLVTLRAYYWSVDEKLLIYDYIPNGNLSIALHGRGGIMSFTPIQWPARMRIMKGVARGLAYIHELNPKKNVHGDLNPNNILLDENMEPQVSDFGLGRLARISGGRPYPMTRQTGLEISFGSGYWAPEVAKGGKPSQKWDVYSYGIILLEMVTGRRPMVQVGEREVGIIQWIELCIEEKRQLGDVLDPNFAEDPDMEEEMVGVLKVALACSSTSPQRRPSMRNVVETIERLSSG